ncbi:conserved membrane hypothetical protein [Candidatus Zixiibacteriota bacterium]|nr:conserved membrane hypothetical protein [candidate division Zixibacteria bacterium]
MLKEIVKLLRPSQWIKNGVVLAGLIFAEKADQLVLVEKSLLVLVAFCFLSSSVYVLNDIVDRDRDRLHPLKKNRPLASGRISPMTAGVTGVILLIAGLGLSYIVGASLLIVSVAYVTLNILYTFLLKNVVIIDVMTIAAGFVLRALAGAVAIRVEFSGWLLVATFVLALFLALGKRRHEITFLQGEATAHRKILEKYSTQLLDQLIGVVTASTVITYLFYTLSRDIQVKLHTQYLYVTIPFVIYGIFRYLYLVHKEEQGGSPTTLLLNDRPLLLDVLLWLASVLLILYIL